MSVVLDAVNTFFGQHHNQPPSSFHEPPPAATSPPPKRSRSPPRSDTPMSQSAPRASSSTTTHTVPAQHEHVPAQTARASSQASQPARSEPPEPALAARPAPPSEQSQPSSQQPTLTPRLSPVDTRQARPRRIKVRDLEHIQRFAMEDVDAFSEASSGARGRSRVAEDATQYEISDMKVEHIIEMVAGLLTKITTTNDQQHEHLHRQPPQLDSASHMSPQTNSVLAFHGKNVPSITILSYLSRIHKYCPTSYEVFLSLLVYFDRMTERVNAGPMQSLREQQELDLRRSESSPSPSPSPDADAMDGIAANTPTGTQQATPPSSGGMEKSDRGDIPGTPHSRARGESPSISSEATLANPVDAYNLSHFFVVDSFNIHRLVIAGVTCASKFFSDIFYTNSRYAKVGGLPLPELNHLELQFLLLNDFRLSVPVEEIEAYGTMLVEFYAREVVAQHRMADAMQVRSFSESSSDSTSTVRG